MTVRALVLTVALVASASLVSAPTAHAVDPTPTLYVSDTTGNDANDCKTAANPCLTIGAAIGKASAGDTIEVAVGTYVETLTISKSLTILGPNAGVSPNDPSNPWNANGARASASEAVIKPASRAHAINITENSLTLDVAGLTIDMTDSWASANKAKLSSRFVHSDKSGLTLTFRRNVFTNSNTAPNAEEISSGNWLLRGNGSLVLTVTENRFTGSEPSNGISAWHSNPGRFAFSENVWLDNGGWAVNIGLDDVASGSFTQNWVGNTAKGDGTSKWADKQGGFLFAST